MGMVGNGGKWEIEKRAITTRSGLTRIFYRLADENDVAAVFETVLDVSGLLQIVGDRSRYREHEDYRFHGSFSSMFFRASATTPEAYAASIANRTSFSISADSMPERPDIPAIMTDVSLIIFEVSGSTFSAEYVAICSVGNGCDMRVGITRIRGFL